MKNVVLSMFSLCLLLLIGCQTQDTELLQEEQLQMPQELVDYKTFLEETLGDNYFLEEELKMISIVNNISLEELKNRTSKEIADESKRMKQKFYNHRSTLETEGLETFLEALQLSPEKQTQLLSSLIQKNTWEKDYNHHYEMATNSLEKIGVEAVVMPENYYRHLKTQNPVQMRDGCEGAPFHLCSGLTLVLGPDFTFFPIGGLGNPIFGGHHCDGDQPVNFCQIQDLTCRTEATAETSDCIAECYQVTNDPQSPCFRLCDRMELIGRLLCDFYYNDCMCVFEG